MGLWELFTDKVMSLLLTSLLSASIMEVIATGDLMKCTVTQNYGFLIMYVQLNRIYSKG